MSPYHRPIPSTWWLKRRPYFFFMMRELTAFFVGVYCVILLVLVYKLGKGQEAYESMLEMLQNPLMIAFHAIALLFSLYHTITWFNLTPKAMVIQIGEKRVPGVLLAGGNYVAWLALSTLLVWFMVKI